MKEVGIGLAVALAAAASAYADEIADNALWIEVKYDLLKAKWPHDADGNLTYGQVLLDCGIGADRSATDCKVKASEPASPAMERAALALAPLYRTWTTADSKLSQTTLVVDVRYDERPELLRLPSYDQMRSVYPIEARRRGAGGVATIRCIVQTTGIGRACKVLNEDRPELGFGPPALILSQAFVFKPATIHGHPVEAEITLPVSFQISGSSEPSSGHFNISQGTTTSYLAGASWSKAPTVAEILGELDKKVGDKFADGKVTLQCSVNKKTGLLNGCVVANFSPGMTEFRGAARSLTSKFQVSPATLAKIKNDVKVNLAFSFPDMTSAIWSGRYLGRVEWTRTPELEPGRKTFPDEASKAGFKTGSATVDCIVGADGSLTKCTTLSESTPGVGFGPMALQIAQGFATNPWTEEGLPAEGAHVKLPIKMVDPNADHAAQSTAPTPPTKP